MVSDHGMMSLMEGEKETIAISKFKAHCLQVLRRVKRTGKPVVVTRFGEPIAEIVPPSEDGPSRRGLGSMEGTVRIVGDIIAPASDPDEWEALRD
jgi:prevent-host-death family protein